MTPEKKNQWSYFFSSMHLAKLFCLMCPHCLEINKSMSSNLNLKRLMQLTWGNFNGVHLNAALNTARDAVGTHCHFTSLRWN